MKRSASILLAVLLISFSITSFAGSAKGPDKDLIQEQLERQDEPVARIKTPGSYYARKVFLFPFDLPGYAVKAVTWPLGAGLRYLQKTHAIDKTLDFLSNDEKTFWVYPIVAGGAGANFGGGVGLRHTDLFHKGYFTAATYKINLKQSQEASFSFGKPAAMELFGKPLSYSFGSNFQRFLQSSYFGVGNSTSQYNRSNYNLYNVNFGAGVSYEFVKYLSVTPYLGFSATQGMGCSNGDYPDVSATFPAAQLEGISLWLQYLDAGIKLSHDTRDRLDYPMKGGFRAFSYHHYFGMNRGDFSYDQYDLDINHYISLWRPRQVLALHAGFRWQHNSGDNDIPFYRLSQLDAGSPLRGFTSGRFRDRNYILMNAEYRFPVWTLIDGAIFYDTGRVYHAVEDISLAHIKYSAGAGLKFRIPNLVVFRMEAAYGGEGVNVMFGASRPL